MPVGKSVSCTSSLADLKEMAKIAVRRNKRIEDPGQAGLLLVYQGRMGLDERIILLFRSTIYFLPTR